MRARLTTIAFAAALAVRAAPAAAQQPNFDTVQVRSQQLASNVYVLTGSGGNIGLAVGNDAVFVVDDQFAPLTPKILAAIKAITPKPVRFVVNTHWHFDHTGGNENMGATGAVIMAHENVRKRMSTEQFIKALNLKQDPAPRAALPIVTFTEGVTFHINDDSVVVVHVPPAHTDGDAIVRFSKANVVHMGDVFNTAGMPFVDLSSGGSIDGVIGAAEKVLAMTDAQSKIIPGHGAVADRAKLQTWRDMLVTMRDRVKREIAAKKTVDQVLADSITKPYAATWTGGHERFVRLLFEELSQR